MKAILSLFAAALAFPAVALAQSPANSPSAYSVPVETFSLGKAKGKFTETVFSAGDYVFAAVTGAEDLSGPISIDVLGASRKVKRVTVRYRFTSLNGAAINSGLCTMKTKTWSGLWNTADNSLYTCGSSGPTPQPFTLEAIVPNIEAQSSARISMTRDNPDKYKVLKARLRYMDELYEAIPTGFQPERAVLNHRVANGYTITRNGRLVGRIDLPDYKGTIVNVNGSYERNFTFITAPKADADGREAVIFFAAQMFSLPEANSPALTQ